MCEADHDGLYQSAFDLYQKAAKLESTEVHLEIMGDNLRATIPGVECLLNDSRVVNTAASLLGDNYVLHPHHYVHKCTTHDQGFHQDGNLPWNERGHYRSHRPDWLFLFYYPQVVDDTNGATEIVAGSQYWTKDFEKEDGWHRGDSMDRTMTVDEMNADDLAYRDKRLQQGLETIGIPNLERRFIHVPKGTVVIGNYDLMHRGSRTSPQASDRFMYKFYFARATEPEAPAWRHEKIPGFGAVRKELKPIVKQNWSWSSGEKTVVPVDDLEDLVDRLTSGQEHEKVEAAYRLGMCDSDKATQILVKGIRSELESTRRASAYGLRILGARATSALVEALHANMPGTRRVAAYALGTVESAASEEAIDALIHCVETDDDDLVRSNAAYSLGQISRATECDTQKIATALITRLVPGAEGVNTSVAEFPRSTVRQSVGYALMQLLINHEVSDETTAAVAHIAVYDTDRYVKGMLLEALMLKVSDDPIAATLASGLIRQRWNIAPSAS